MFNFIDFYDFKLIDEAFDAVEKELNDMLKVSNEKKDDEGHSYYHKITDKYENGERVSHTEKEVKDGKVIKDVNEKKAICDKACCKDKEEVNEPKIEKVRCDYYKKLLGETEERLKAELCEKKEAEIKYKENVKYIEHLEAENQALKKKLESLKDLLK